MYNPFSYKNKFVKTTLGSIQMLHVLRQDEAGFIEGFITETSGDTTEVVDDDALSNDEDVISEGWIPVVDPLLSLKQLMLDHCNGLNAGPAMVDAKTVLQTIAQYAHMIDEAGL